ncbi:MAG: cytochrome b/b6 domain-containing protein [Deltaproteobacteria bacterium]|nr:cytochrome b/b6 domain-containing protein [Deltaproteobacteria bacterium]
MTTERIYVATLVDRIWHWIHVVGILILILSGLNIHFTREFNVLGSVEHAVKIHNVTGVLVSIDWAVFLLYNLFTRRIRYYLPNRDDLLSGILRQARFYLFGIFRGEEPPFEVSVDRKFNPLQKWTYLGIMGLVVPFQIASGLYMLHVLTTVTVQAGHERYLIFMLHTVATFLSAVFVIIHVYLATTGEKPSSHFELMITGYHERRHAPPPEEDGKGA